MEVIEGGKGREIQSADSGEVLSLESMEPSLIEKEIEWEGHRITIPLFEGPLDLLIHLLKKHKMNIFDIPVARITEQYLHYVKFLEELDIDMAGDFLVMATTLMQIKSRMLIPKEESGIEFEEEDPRKELVLRLIEYKRFRDAADRLDEKRMVRSRIFVRSQPETLHVQPEVEEQLKVNLVDLMDAFKDVLDRASKDVVAEVVREQVRVEDRVSVILRRLREEGSIEFRSLFEGAKTKSGLVATFLALLELIRLGKATARQEAVFSDIRIHPVEGADLASAVVTEEYEGES